MVVLDFLLRIAEPSTIPGDQIMLVDISTNQKVDIRDVRVLLSSVNVNEDSGSFLVTPLPSDSEIYRAEKWRASFEGVRLERLEWVRQFLAKYGNEYSSADQLTALTELKLRNNRIQDVAPLAGLTALTGLHLGNNQIQDVAPLNGLNAKGCFILI